MSGREIVFCMGWAAASFWLGVLFAVTTLDLAAYHDKGRWQRKAAVNVGVFAAFLVGFWWLA